MLKMLWLLQVGMKGILSLEIWPFLSVESLLISFNTKTVNLGFAKCVDFYGKKIHIYLCMLKIWKS